MLYLDVNASNPVDPRVAEAMMRCFASGAGNAGSPHRFGAQAKQQVHRARDQIAAGVGARRHEVVFTSGATESNNLVILGAAPHGQATGRRHLVSTQIEHKAVLEPLAVLGERGFDVTLVAPQSDGRVSAADVLDAVRDDTLLVSVMHVNNETGVRQPIREIAEGLSDRDVLFHVDAAQGFGKDNASLAQSRIDLISLSGHKVFGPQGVGALIVRRRDGRPPPLTPLMHGGGQEQGLRPGTLPTPLIVGFGLAAELAQQECEARAAYCRRLRTALLDRLAPLGIVLHGDLQHALPHVVNISFPHWHADQVIEALDGVAAVSDGAACTSVCATASHVLSAMGVDASSLEGAVRISWSRLTPENEFLAAADAMKSLLTRPT
ncbi:MAG: aminotransferase class V-fold PLP-dependent enzyme [Planctomycetales bacterium]|nr:aminotransferase class V-fold PLP-dependent enzyme [Planctomycetales bacterium]